MKTLKTNANRCIALGTLGAMTAGGLMTQATPAQAGSSTWKKAAIVAGVATGYGLLKHKGKIATVGAVATVGSYYMYKRAKKKEQRDAQYRRRARRYR